MVMVLGNRARLLLGAASLPFRRGAYRVDPRCGSECKGVSRCSFMLPSQVHAKFTLCQKKLLSKSPTLQLGLQHRDSGSCFSSCKRMGCPDPSKKKQKGDDRQCLLS